MAPLSPTTLQREAGPQIFTASGPIQTGFEHTDHPMYEVTR